MFNKAIEVITRPLVALITIATSIGAVGIWIGSVSARVDNVEKDQSKIEAAIKASAQDIKQDINRVDDKVDKVVGFMLEDRRRK